MKSRKSSGAASSAKGKAGVPRLSFQSISTHRRPANKDKEVKDEPDGQEGAAQGTGALPSLLSLWTSL